MESVVQTVAPVTTSAFPGDAGELHSLVRYHTDSLATNGQRRYDVTTTGPAASADNPGYREESVKVISSRLLGHDVRDVAEAIRRFPQGWKFFEYEYVESFEELHKVIGQCEGRHAQQAIFSTYHGSLTQICFGCRRIRSNLLDGGGQAVRRVAP